MNRKVTTTSRGECSELCEVGVDLEGRTIELRELLGVGKWNGEGMGRGRSIYKQPGSRVDEDRTTQKGGFPSK
jgi:hypothetical protein